MATVTNLKAGRIYLVETNVAATRSQTTQLDPDCFQLSSIVRTATRDFRNGVTVRVRRAFFPPPLSRNKNSFCAASGGTEAPFSGFNMTEKGVPSWSGWLGYLRGLGIKVGRTVSSRFEV